MLSGPSIQGHVTSGLVKEWRMKIIHPMSSVKVIGDVEFVGNCGIYARNGCGLQKILYFCVIMSNVLGLRSIVKGQRQP